jgi:glycosyltransferase involved in cell wall biosynthesis
VHVESGRYLYGGAKQVVYLLEGLGKRGVDSILACPQDSDIASEARQLGVGVFEMPMGGDLDLPLIWRLRGLIRKECPDLVHLHSRRGADILGGLAARLAGVKSVVSRRVDNPESPFVVKWKYRLFDRVITISQGIADVLVAEGLPAEKLVCVRSAIDVEAYQLACDEPRFRAAFGLGKDELVVAMVAQLIRRKGHQVMLEAMPRLLERFPRLKLLIFGRGPLHDELAQLIEQMGLGDRVRLVGFYAALTAILPCFDLLAHPALMEGLGIAILQAASAGLPVVAVKAGGMPEAVEDGVNGRLVSAGSVEELIAAMEALLSDPELRRRMGDAGREKMRREFSVDCMVDGNLRVYQELLGHV